MVLHLRQRGKLFHFRRRIPAALQPFFNVDVVQVPLNTDSEHVAKQRAQHLNSILEDHWAKILRSRRKGTIDVLKQEAMRFGVKGTNTAKFVEDEVVERVVARLQLAKSLEPNGMSEVILGVASGCSPGFSTSDALEQYLEFESPNINGHSAGQKRTWINEKRRAVKNFERVVGLKQLAQIERTDVLQFREWWATRIKDDGLSPSSANRDLGNLKGIIPNACDNEGLELDVEALFVRTRFKKRTNSRLPFDDEFIRNVLLDRSSMAMSDECQLLIYAMAETGARVGELVGLDASNGDIVLDHDIPHIKIRVNAIRGLKSKSSERDIPLVGSALIAFRELVDGFVRYRGKNNLISSTINKYLREHNLLPTCMHSLYSLRHSFEDRLTAAEPPDKVQAALMGHSYYRPRYGMGPTLAQKHEWLKRIELIKSI